jgi:CRP-like cAMP-binding protein
MDAAKLKDIPLFASLSKNELEAVARYADEVEVPAGRHLADEGEFAHQFFVIESGTVEVTKDGKHVADLGPKDFFGEIALVETERRVATVVSKTPMELIVIFGPSFRALERSMPSLAEKIRGAVKQRLAELNALG